MSEYKQNMLSITQGFTTVQLNVLNIQIQEKKIYYLAPWYRSETFLYLQRTYGFLFPDELKINIIGSISNEQ